jgi:hypothetical protein
MRPRSGIIRLEICADADFFQDFPGDIIGDLTSRRGRILRNFSPLASSLSRLATKRSRETSRKRSSRRATEP